MEMLSAEASGLQPNATGERSRTGALLSLQILCGENLDAVLAAGPDEKRRVTRKLLHRLERERLRGLRGHWSYDLNRHIGLRQALDLVAGGSSEVR